MSIEYRKFNYKEDIALFSDFPDDECFETNITNICSLKEFDESTFVAVVAVEDYRILGYAFGYVLPLKTLLPMFLYVIPERRGQGIGVNITRRLEKESGCSCSMIYFNPDKREYYERQGYRVGKQLVALKEING